MNKNQEELNRYYSETLVVLGKGVELSVKYSDEIKQWVWNLQELEYDITVEKGITTTYEKAILEGKETWDAYCQALCEVMEAVRK